MNDSLSLGAERGGQHSKGKENNARKIQIVKEWEHTPNPRTKEEEPEDLECKASLNYIVRQDLKTKKYVNNNDYAQVP